MYYYYYKLTSLNEALRLVDLNSPAQRCQQVFDPHGALEEDRKQTPL